MASASAGSLRRRLPQSGLAESAIRPPLTPTTSMTLGGAARAARLCCFDGLAFGMLGALDAGADSAVTITDCATSAPLWWGSNRSANRPAPRSIPPPPHPLLLTHTPGRCARTVVQGLEGTEPGPGPDDPEGDAVERWARLQASGEMEGRRGGSNARGERGLCKKNA